MTKSKRLLISLLVCFCVIFLMLIIYAFVPYFYAGDFCLEDYQTDIAEYSTEKVASSNNSTEINNARTASAYVDELLKKDGLADNVNHVNIVYYDKANNAWLIKSRNRFVMFNGTLYEGATTIIDENGNVLMAYIGT